jgi:hypothetical protein
MDGIFQENNGTSPSGLNMYMTDMCYVFAAIYIYIYTHTHHTQKDNLEYGMVE